MDAQAQFEAILNEYYRRLSADPKVRGILRRIGKGKATLADTAALSNRAADLLGEAFGAAVLDIPEDVREAVCEGLLRERYDSMNETLAAVQTALDEAQGIHLTPQKAPFPIERVQQIAHSLLDPNAKPETIRRRANKPVATVAKSFHDDYIRVNAKLRNDLGLKPILQRFGTGCCAWCSAVAGKWRFGEQPDDVFRRHDNCDCVIIYDTQVLRGVKTQDGGRSKTWTEVDPSDLQTDPPKVLSRSEAEQLQENALGRLTLAGERDIINTKPVRISMQTFGNRNIPRMSDRELQKSIESWTKRAEEHKEYIENPIIHCPDWESYDPRKQAGLKQHWEKEIRNFNEDIQAAIDELERREKS